MATKTVTRRKLAPATPVVAPLHHEPATGDRVMNRTTIALPLFRELTAYAMEVSIASKSGAKLALALLGVGTDDGADVALTRSWWSEVLAAVLTAIEELTDPNTRKEDFFDDAFGVRECAALCRWAYEISELMRLSFEVSK